MNNQYSIVIPAYNEEHAIGMVLEEILGSDLGSHSEVIVVNDNSSDNTLLEAEKYPVRVFSNVQNFGYGYSLKRGISNALYDHIIILDADGSYPVSALPTLITEYEKGFDMVVGARKGSHYRGSVAKQFARTLFRMLSEFTTGRKIPDINSGCRVFKKDIAMRFFSRLSSGFSFTTTITLAFMLTAHSVQYLPIPYHKRTGKSKVKYVRDTLRSAQIIIEAIIYYNPLKLYLLCVCGLLLLGIMSGAIAFLSFRIALFLFMTGAMSILLFALGFLCVMLRFIAVANSNE